MTQAMATVLCVHWLKDVRLLFINSFLLLAKKSYKSPSIAFNFFLSSLSISLALLSCLIASSLSSLLLPCLFFVISMRSVCS